MTCSVTGLVNPKDTHSPQIQGADEVSARSEVPLNAASAPFLPVGFS